MSYCQRCADLERELESVASPVPSADTPGADGFRVMVDLAKATGNWKAVLEYAHAKVQNPDTEPPGEPSDKAINAGMDAAFSMRLNPSLEDVRDLGRAMYAVDPVRGLDTERLDVAQDLYTSWDRDPYAGPVYLRLVLPQGVEPSSDLRALLDAVRAKKEGT